MKWGNVRFRFGVRGRLSRLLLRALCWAGYHEDWVWHDQFHARCMTCGKVGRPSELFKDE
jgi:hypothetical protein